MSQAAIANEAKVQETEIISSDIPQLNEILESLLALDVQPVGFADHSKSQIACARDWHKCH